MKRKTLSNEFLRKHFSSNFALANFAIHIGREEVKKGNFMNLDQFLQVLENRVHQIQGKEEKQRLGIKD